MAEKRERRERKDETPERPKEAPAERTGEEPRPDRAPGPARSQARAEKTRAGAPPQTTRAGAPPQTTPAEGPPQETRAGAPPQKSPAEGPPQTTPAEAPPSETRAEGPPPKTRPGGGEAAAKDPDGGGAETAGAAKPREEPEAEPARRRLSRLRFSKKKDMPGGLWLKCESCAQVVYRKELEGKGRVCPACGFHFTLPGRERIAMVLDEGTWVERFADLATLDRLGFVEKVPYAEKMAKTVERLGQEDALICGIGEIHGRRAVVAVLDFSFMGGSMGEVVGEKVALAADLARTERLPLVLFTSSGGARMQEGVLSLMQMAKTCAALADFNDAGGFSVCVMTHPTTGGVTASFASVCDVTLAEPGALIGFAGPRVIATTLKQELPEGFQRAEFLLAKGQLDRIVRREELPALLASLLDYGAGAFLQEGGEADEVPRLRHHRRAQGGR